ncbi:hypothetical protein ElyMa_006198400 [Elysia marginata]|uniref:Hexosyltransferase n=1 Tax=Elysia marginata TaxID=1093978 RepID=A0AAV4H3R3_9GAST|nr:hypothetical protein ElyMa_006198400 [Elysia marginata]
MLELALTFVLNCCPGTGYILVTDPDNYANLPGLVHRLHQLHEDQDDDHQAMRWPGHSKEEQFVNCATGTARINPQPHKPNYSGLPSGSCVISGKAASKVLRIIRNDYIK